LKVNAETINPAEWIKNNWLNYPNDTGQWTTNSINGNPALGSTKNVDWTGYLNTFAMDTKDAVFEFKMYQNENADDDNMGWTFRHNYIDSPTAYKNHSFYAFVTNGGWSDANGNIPSGLYKKSYGKNIGWNPNHGMTALKTFDFNRAPKTLYNVKIEVKDEIGGTRIKIWIDEKEVVNYLDIEPILSGGYGPFSFSQAHAYFYDMNINGSSVYNIPPSISVTSPAQNQQFLSTDKISLVGSANDVDNRGTLSTYYQFDDKTQQLIWTKEQNGSPQPFNLSLSIPSDIKYGNHTLTVWAKDSENAESQKQVINFFVKDINRPNVTHSIVNGTNNTKTININATDSESGVKRIKLPDGIYVNGSTATYDITTNGNHTFLVEDNAGNIKTYIVSLSNIGYKPILTVNPKEIENHISLNWEMKDKSQSYNYNVFRQKDVDISFNSIKTTINTSLIDEGGKDVNMPTKPMVTNYSLKNGIVTLSYNGSVDKGTNYKYYIEATGQNYPIKTTSDIKETNIISGLKGYSYIIDTNPNTIPDNTIETVNGNNINFTLTNKTMYFHIKAVDNVGNSSETVHFKVEDNENPILNITGTPTEWTKEDVLLSISASDKLSGIKSIILPNGNVINSDKATYLTDKNGNLTFKAIDNVGNITTKTITIDKIDKIGPELTYKKEISSSKLSGFINISLNDTMSGVDYLVLPDNTKVYNVSNYKYPINNNGIYYFMAYDKLGNGSSLSISVDELLTNINPSGISKIEYKLEGATVQNWTVYNSPFVITNEGITIIRVRAYDKAGNLSDEKVSTAKIDKTKPINNSIIIKLK